MRFHLAALRPAVLFAAACFGVALRAQTPAVPAPAAPTVDPPPAGYASVEPLWPGVVPGALGSGPADVPQLFCYPAPGPGVHAAVVVLPGGGYLHLVNEKEGAAEARWLNAHGLSAYVLRYRLSPRYRYPAPMQDGLRAVRFVRAHAAAWHLRPDAIGVWGFSAGGHLAGYLATADPHAMLTGTAGVTGAAQDAVDGESAHPDFAILSYARLSLSHEIPGTWTMESLLGKDAPQAQNDQISPVLHVTAASSPSFLYANEFDEKVNSLNATAFYDALRRAGVHAELHVFQRGAHGTGMGQNLPGTPELAVWPLLLENWLAANGWLGSHTVTASGALAD